MPPASVDGLPPNGNHIAIPIITLCVVITAISSGLRFYSKFLIKQFNIADYLTIISFVRQPTMPPKPTSATHVLLFQLPSQPLFWVYIYYSYRLSWTSGYPVHQIDMPLKDIAAFSYVCFVATLLYMWIIALIKVSILLEWTYILAPNGSPNLVLDLVPVILAQRAIWGLNMSLRTKMRVSLVFLIGIIGIAATAVRVYFATRFYTSSDTSYFFSIMALCSLSETTCVQLVLSVPMVPKAVIGLSHNKVYTRIMESLTPRSKATSASNSTDFYESQPYPIRTPGNRWSIPHFSVSRWSNKQDIALYYFMYVPKTSVLKL
ncbi:hypothetical protein PT974_01973 [Cladobotryum mycophilum]|uniref:Rhodopsin domain-containing protein n=1 Tax=Cladobotryum mycophilum TaxID=491253 RepID=A0ABR0SY20_9HYPO